jgi:hypothetical protein
MRRRQFVSGNFVASRLVFGHETVRTGDEKPAEECVYWRVCAHGSHSDTETEKYVTISLFTF